MTSKMSGKNNVKNTDNKLLAALPPIGAYKSRKEWEVVCWRKISRNRKLLDLLTTPYDRRNLVMRAAAINGITAGKSYREISKELWLSLQTISVIKKAINENGYRSYLERSKKERRPRKYSKNLEESKRRKPRGWYRRTKYGTVRIPGY